MTGESRKENRSLIKEREALDPRFTDPIEADDRFRRVEGSLRDVDTDDDPDFELVEKALSGDEDARETIEKATGSSQSGRPLFGLDPDEVRREGADQNKSRGEVMREIRDEFPALDETHRVDRLDTQHEMLAEYARRRGIDPEIEGRVQLHADD